MIAVVKIQRYRDTCYKLLLARNSPRLGATVSLLPFRRPSSLSCTEHAVATLLPVRKPAELNSGAQ